MPRQTAQQDHRPRSATGAHTTHSRTYRHLSARPTSVNTLKIDEDYLHIKQISAQSGCWMHFLIWGCSRRVWRGGLGRGSDGWLAEPRPGTAVRSGLQESQ